MDPAQAVHEEVKLPGVVADQAHVQVKALRDQAADQRPFGGQGYGPGTFDEVAPEMSGPVLRVRQHHGACGQHRAVTGRQAPRRHVRQGFGIDLIAAFALEQFQEIDPALVVGAGEPGKILITNIGTVAVTALMPGAGIIGLDIRGGGQPRRLERGFFLMESLMAFGQQVIELTGGDLKAPVVELGQQQRLGHVSLVVLIQYVADQRRAIMAVPGRRWDRRRHIIPVGKPPLFQQITGVVGTNLQVLDHKPSVPFKLRPRRHLRHGDTFRHVNRQLRRLRPARPPTARGVTLRRRRVLGTRLTRRFQRVRLQLRTRRTALQAPQLILQPLNLLLLFSDDLQQTAYQGRLLALGNLWQFQFERRGQHDDQYTKFNGWTRCYLQLMSIYVELTISVTVHFPPPGNG